MSSGVGNVSWVWSTAPSPGVGVSAQKEAGQMVLERISLYPMVNFLRAVQKALYHQAEGKWAEGQNSRSHTMAGMKIEQYARSHGGKRLELPPLTDQELHTRSEHIQEISAVDKCRAEPCVSDLKWSQCLGLQLSPDLCSLKCYLS
jgi:hypothetical protein